MIRPLAALLALAVPTVAQAQSACLPQREAEALVMTLAPTVIQSVAATCAASLPPSAMLRRASDRLTAKFAAEGDAAWPVAREGLKKLIGPQSAQLADSEVARPMVTAMVAPMLAGEVKAKDCPNIDRVLTLIDPLPAKNTAALIVALLDITGATRAKPGRRAAFTLCPVARP